VPCSRAHDSALGMFPLSIDEKVRVMTEAHGRDDAMATTPDQVMNEAGMMCTDEQAACPDEQRCTDDRAMWSRKAKAIWSQPEDLFILGATRRFGTQWHAIAEHLPGRSPDAVRNRWHRLQKVYLSELGDSEAQWLVAASDAAVKALALPEQADRGRAPWTAEEDQRIIDGVKRHGCKWRVIAADLPGRSDSSARNRWLRLQKDRQECPGASDEEPMSTGAESPLDTNPAPIVRQDAPIVWTPPTHCSQYSTHRPVVLAQPLYS